MRALPVALTLLDQARARKHDTHLSNGLTGQAFGLAGAGDAGIGTLILIGDHEYVFEDRGARRVREDPAAPVNLAGEMRATGLMEPEDGPLALCGHPGCPGRVMAGPAAGDRRGEEDEQA